MKELINAVMEQQSVGACKATNDKDITPIKVTEPTAERLPRANISVRNWLVDDVASWFHKNGISHELRILYDFQSGSELLDYGNDFRRNFDQEKKDTRKRFEKKFGEPMNTVQFNRFKDALYRLIDKQDCIQRSYRF
ncbi:unnamed protein product [Didymodactylos carnosus]|nr:unnamed protein product [Didymodactylos carnosus]CAF4056205.1 unnamed protein product [Didymodactylos carnosus]